MILLLSGYHKPLPERAEPAAEIADALRHLTPCPTWSEPDVVNAPLVNDIKRRGSSCCSDYAPPTRSDRECRNARTSAPGVVAGHGFLPGVLA